MLFLILDVDAGYLKMKELNTHYSDKTGHYLRGRVAKIRQEAARLKIELPPPNTDELLKRRNKFIERNHPTYFEAEG